MQTKPYLMIQQLLLLFHKKYPICLPHILIFHGVTEIS